MTTIKRTTAIMLSLLICIFAPSVMAADSYLTINGFTFEIDSNGNAVIHEYDGNDKNVVIPEKLLGAKVCEISDYAFFGNTEIESISFKNAKYLTSIGANAFNGCTGLNELEIPETVNKLGFGAFQGCSELTKVIINGAVDNIPAQCFLGCSNLNKVVISDSVTSLGDYSFAQCDVLTDITIPSSVQNISENTFANCENLRIFCEENSYAQSYAQAHDVENVVPEECPLGDVNLDGAVDIMDATLIQLYKIGTENIITSELQLRLADVNRDNKVSIRDATMIQMYLAHYFDKF